MSRACIAVRLRAPDPAAITALSTLKRIMPDEAPDGLSRYDLWEFEMADPSVSPEGGFRVVRELLGHYTDIVNPNKQVYRELYEGSELPDPIDGMTQLGIVVRDHDDSESTNWTRILATSRFPVDGVRIGVLWLLAYPGEGAAVSRLERMALGTALTTSRLRGLLANPVSQSVDSVGTRW